jgi:DNA-binding transcriptional LysR family regulator
MLPPNFASVETFPLFDMPIVAVMRKDHALAGKHFVRAADLAAHKLIATPVGPMRNDLEQLFYSEGVDFHPRYTVSGVDHGCALALEIGAVIITDPLAPLAVDPTAFALVPLRPVRVMQTSMFTPALKPESRLRAAFMACVREEARAIEKRVAAMMGGAARAGRRAKAAR